MIRIFKWYDWSCFLSRRYTQIDHWCWFISECFRTEARNTSPPLVNTLSISSLSASIIRILEPLTIELTVDAKVVNTFKNGHILSSLCCLAWILKELPRFRATSASIHAASEHMPSTLNACMTSMLIVSWHVRTYSNEMETIVPTKKKV
jgi:hypothetical protein